MKSTNSPALIIENQAVLKSDGYTEQYLIMKDKNTGEYSVKISYKIDVSKAQSPKTFNINLDEQEKQNFYRRVNMAFGR